jgi:hypothetical protein
MTKKVVPPSNLVNELTSSAFFHKQKDRQIEQEPNLQTSHTPAVASDGGSDGTESIPTSTVSDTKTVSKKALALTSLDKIIKSVNSNADTSEKMTVRMTKAEKKAIEDFFALINNHTDIKYTKLSVSKLIRICAKYMVDNHSQEILERYIKASKDEFWM